MRFMQCTLTKLSRYANSNGQGSTQHRQSWYLPRKPYQLIPPVSRKLSSQAIYLGTVLADVQNIPYTILYDFLRAEINFNPYGQINDTISPIMRFDRIGTLIPSRAEWNGAKLPLIGLPISCREIISQIQLIDTPEEHLQYTRRESKN